MNGCQNHSGSADAALGAAGVKKRLLQKLQAAVRGETLDRNNLCAIRLKHRYEAAIHEHPVDQNRAGATFAFTTAFLRSRQSKLVAKNIQETLHRVRMHGL